MYTLTRTVSNSDNAARHDIICKRGDTFWRGFRFWQDNARTIPLDITDSDFQADVVRATGLKPVFQFRIGSGLTITDINILEMDLEAAVMQVGNGSFLWDMQKILSDGTVKTQFEGSFIINMDVTPVL